ncbi:uncharacterized protein LOC118429957 isoform X2 [Branchiostoma floridae]|uniref:Uncharacterized protein LOC118429957 isoform X2 n=1 Tax=Branchiostoma floridae TaxID=7739 RepID=A0A9J7N9W1_BRAFL|nr:uncharacterized protein LOC118429957 isoform X2 [Branchiostoma floridae]
MFAGIFSIFLERVNTLQATLICRELVYLKKKSAVKRLKSSLQFWSPLAELVQVDPRARADTSSCWGTRAVVSNTTAYDGHQPLLYCCSRDMEIQCQQGHGRDVEVTAQNCMEWRRMVHKRRCLDANHLTQR